MLYQRIGAKCIAEFNNPENVVVGITTFKGKLIIATTKGVYSYPEKKYAKHNNPRKG